MKLKHYYLKSKGEHGAAMVEFAIIALLLFMVLFMVIELGRWMYIWNTLAEVTRRGARVASVCSPDHNYIKQAAVFGTTSTSNTDTPILNGLTTNKIGIRYFNSDGTTPSSDTTDPFHYHFVEVYIKREDANAANVFNHQFIAPILGQLITLPAAYPSGDTSIAFPTRLPIESRGDGQTTSGTNPNNCS